MYRRSSARPLQMWFRYCRAKELVWKAWEHYGRRYCEAFQIEGGFEGQTPELMFESKQQAEAYSKWAADKKKGVEQRRQDMPPGFDYRDVEDGWWPMNDLFTHGADPVAVCKKLYICPT